MLEIQKDFLNNKFSMKIEDFIIKKLPINSYRSNLLGRIRDFFSPNNNLNAINSEASISFLKSLDIFSEIFVSKNKFFLKPKKINISVKSSINSQNNPEMVGSLNFPNVYGNGENISFNCWPSKGFKVNFRKPIFTNNSLNFVELNAFEEIKKMNENDFNSKGVEMSFKSKNDKFILRNENFGRKVQSSINLCKTADNFSCDISSGFYGHSPFFKIISSINHKFSLEPFYLKSSLRGGFIRGKINSSYKFSLGQNTIGYKENSINVENGGKAFFELNNEVGIKFGNFNFFMRKNLALNSTKNKMYDFFKDAQKSIPKLKENVGLGLGFGVSYLYNGMNIGMAYSVPFKGENGYVFIFDAEI